MLVLSILCLATVADAREVVATAGQEVVLECGLEQDVGCSWNRRGEGGLEVDTRGDQGRVSQDGCSLRLQPVLFSDEGSYTCRSQGRSRNTDLKVQVEVGLPHILEGREGGVLEVKRGRTLSLHCETRGGWPAAEVEWRKDGEVVRELESVTEEVARLEEGWKTSSVFTFRPEQSTNVTCAASNAVSSKARLSEPLEVLVRAPPRVEVQVQGAVREGDSFEVLCKSSAYPQDIAYRWFFRGAELEGITNNSILIEEISRMYDQSDITCLVENEEGEARASTNLNVQFPPTLLLHPRSQVAKKKDNVTFHCVAEGNPTPEYIWTRGRQDSLLQAGRQNLSLVASEQTETVYRCHVFADGQDIVSSMPASLTLIRRPVVTSDRERWASVGQDVILQCSTRAASNRTRIAWLRCGTGGAGQDLQPVVLGGRLSVVSSYRDGTRSSSLLFKDLNEKDFGEYACFAENVVGTDLGRTRLSQQSVLDAVSAAAIATVVLLALLLIFGIFIYYKFLKKKDAEKW